MSELLGHIKTALKHGEPYPEYPSRRLVLPEMTLDIPDGPWQMNDTDRPSPDATNAFERAGYKTDAVGRPLHPLATQMLTDPSIGVVTGRGRYWRWGPNFAADAIVITEEPQPHVLLIQRGDTGDWALPGGFINRGEKDAAKSARRELAEETQLHIDTPGILVYKGVVGDKRTTLHAWVETSAYLFRIPERLPVIGSDDARDARWVALDALEGALFGSHRYLLDQAIKSL